MPSSRSHHIPAEYQPEDLSARLNWLRAAVLGANDGIVSTAALLVGVTASGASPSTVIAVGVAGIAAGALSMGVGEYVSVSSQRDAEKAQLEREQYWQQSRPDWELEQLVYLHQQTGMSAATARQAAIEQTEFDPIAAHARAHLNIDPDNLISPWHAALASLLAFTAGGALPMLMSIFLSGPNAQLLLAVTVVTALAITGWGSAVLGQSRIPTAIVRNVVGGAAAMAITYGIGTLFNA